jgi:Kdo2-lipid IVA lauroyltransferase/acyltransferase
MADRKAKSPGRRAVEQFIVHWYVLLTSALVRVLPLRAIRFLARLLAGAVDLAFIGRRGLVDANLRAVFGDTLTAAERRRIRKLAIANATKTMFELVKLRWMTAEDLKREVSIEGEEYIRAAREKGKGVIFITAHFGNWEYAGAYLSVLGYPINVIARDANDAFTRDLINSARESKGIHVFGRRDARPLLRSLRDNECLAILPDQHAAEAAVRVEFLGRPADTATGPTTFALRTGAAVVAGVAIREPNDHIHMVVGPEVEITDTGDYQQDIIINTQRINDVLGEHILAHPEQWLWLHDRWKAERAPAAPAGPVEKPPL